jgi:hypothetical protein
MARESTEGDAMRITSMIVLAAVLLSGCSQVTDMLGNIGETKLQTAMKSCAGTYSGYIDVLDNGKTLSIDGEGKEDQGAPIEELVCVLNAIPVPSYIMQRMDKTRALDGMQREVFDTFDVSWSYHPDNGLDIVIHEQ